MFTYDQASKRRKDTPAAIQGEMKKLAAPLLLTPHRDLRRLHQQKAQQHVALLADVPQSAPISAGLLLWHQPDVAGQLLAAVEAHGLATMCFGGGMGAAGIFGNLN